MEYEIVSNVGNREHNEDCACGTLVAGNKRQRGFFVLADGLGGHGRGEVASQFVTNMCMEYYSRNHDSDDLIEKSIEYVQEGLLQLQNLENARDEMKTTIVALRIEEEYIRWAHVGDSRLYYFLRNKLVTRTLDHSIPQMLALAGEIKEQEIRNHPERNKLLRVMGTEWEDPQYVISDAVKRTDREAFLLCSDGFWENITEKEMVKCLKRSKNAGQWLKAMNEIVQERGKYADMDNNTALAVMT